MLGWVVVLGEGRQGDSCDFFFFFLVVGKDG